MLQQVFQQQAEEWAAERGQEAPGLVPRCDELGVFLKYAYALSAYASLCFGAVGVHKL
ncbi:hypothetical protein BO82DRAFT_398978 [Aspergillus uvarum CBS 121591]|uniref:Uncharacterized protein n=1 Tax=Aspergillus uvarum CBS 121591 TaxID=1448315 RepID=A0A319CPZ2_9EURO|nr:hypothetical protein BO82DRAFT_398978 [Aspergillus uvarum CBS 121591]PYH85027.1 hypothetical protein BO82DRAFT_398978 [Aspergillus uvarum CBS 121591]